MTRIQVLLVSVGAVLLLAATQSVHAQSGLKIGYVNVQFLIQNAPQTQEVNQRLRDEFAPRDAELLRLQEELQEKFENYQRDASVMAEAERARIERELTEGDRNLQRRQAELQEDVNIRQSELVAELQAQVAARVQSWASAEGYDFIFTNVVYASEAVDITAEVLAGIGGATPTTSR